MVLGRNKVGGVLWVFSRSSIGSKMVDMVRTKITELLYCVAY